MKFNKHNSYRSKIENPKCPTCKSGANVTRLVGKYKCVYCNKIFYDTEKGGQQSLC